MATAFKTARYSDSNPLLKERAERRNASLRATNHLHPVFHGQSYHAGSRIDIERQLPVDLELEDIEMLLEDFSEPPRFEERLSPVGMQIGEESVRGRNFADMLVKSYRHFAKIFQVISMSIEQSLRNNFRERGMVPFQSLGLDIDFLHRIIEDDHAVSDNNYGRFMDLFSTGIMTPCATTPFHTLLPRMTNSFDIRLMLRMGLKLYWPMVNKYQEYIQAAHEEEIFTCLFWLPEGGYTREILEILYEEFQTRAEIEGIENPHLILLLDNEQVLEGEHDALMKSWNVIEMSDGKYISVVFRDRFFSEWVTFSNPSVKKLLDRTIAKVDSELNGQDVDYGWAHYEDVEALGLNNKAAPNFEQKIIKLTELSYLPFSPDIIVRRKILGKLGVGAHEPVKIDIKEDTAWNDWHFNSVSLGRWDGVLDSHADILLVDENRPYVRRTRGARINEQGHQCWKIAYNKARDIVSDAIKGDPETMENGLLGVLASMIPTKNVERKRENVMQFLNEYSMVYWREHYIEHELSEADIQLDEIATENLLRDVKGELTEEEICIAGTAAQSYFFALNGYNSVAITAENIDQRATYQNVVMTTLGLSGLLHCLHWTDKKDEARDVLEVFKEHFLRFDEAYDRYRLATFGVTRDEWYDSIKSEVPDSNLNVIARAGTRVAAKHLRRLGYKKDFTEEDEHISTNCGHLWSWEIEGGSYRWENKTFCGVREE